MAKIENEQRRFQEQIMARVIKVLTPIGAVVILVHGIVGYVFNPEQLTRLVTVGVAFVLLIVSWGMMLAGRTRLVSHMYVVLANASILTGMAVNDGVRAPVFQLTFCLLALVGWLYGRSWTIVFLAIYIAMGAVFAWLGWAGMLRELPPPPQPVYFVMMATYMILITIITIIPHGMLREALEQSEARRAEAERLRLAIDQSGESVVVLDRRGNVTFVNPAFTRITGYSGKDIIGQNAAVLDTESRDDGLFRRIWEKLKTGRSWHGRIASTRKSGEMYTADTLVSPVHDHAGALVNVVAVSRDVTEELRREEALRQAQKMNAIGQLAGGIAHDFNNILGGIVGFTEMALDEVSPDGKASRYLEKVLLAGERAESLVRNILTFSRRRSPDAKSRYLGPTVQEALELLGASIPSSVRIDATLESESAPVEADAAQIHEVVMNLATNAVHAMEEKGVLSIRLFERFVDTPESGRIGELASGPYTVVELEDTGGGMNEAVLSLIFEPFFTTKKVGKGTGMGLSVVYGIMDSHGGNIQVTSIPGQGSTFSLYFPQIDRPSVADRISVPRVSGGNERILLVDDEPILVEIATAFLTECGYRVTATTRSRDALASFHGKPEGFDVLITDQTMPELTGLELMEEVKRVRPEMPIILCTGFSSSIGNKSARELGVSRLLAKPVSVKKLEQIIREVLDGQRGEG